MSYASLIKKEPAISAVHKTKRCSLIGDFVQKIILEELCIERMNKLSVIWILGHHIWRSLFMRFFLMILLSKCEKAFPVQVLSYSFSSFIRDGWKSVRGLDETNTLPSYQWNSLLWPGSTLRQRYLLPYDSHIFDFCDIVAVHRNGICDQYYPLAAHVLIDTNLCFQNELETWEESSIKLILLV